MSGLTMEPIEPLSELREVMSPRVLMLVYYQYGDPCVMANDCRQFDPECSSEESSRSWKGTPHLSATT